MVETVYYGVSGKETIINWKDVEDGAMNRDELNAIYRELEKRMHKIVGPFTSLHKGFEFSCGYYSGHYHKDAEGK